MIYEGDRQFTQAGSGRCKTHRYNANKYSAGNTTRKIIDGDGMLWPRGVLTDDTKGVPEPAPVPLGIDGSVKALA